MTQEDEMRIGTTVIGLLALAALAGCTSPTYGGGGGGGGGGWGGGSVRRDRRREHPVQERPQREPEPRDRHRRGGQHGHMDLGVHGSGVAQRPVAGRAQFPEQPDRDG